MIDMHPHDANSPGAIEDYWVLVPEPPNIPEGSRFDGLRAVVALAATPCVQLGHGPALPGTVDLAGDSDELLAQSRLLVTGSTRWRDRALAFGVPTILLSDEPTTAAKQASSTGVIASPTGFRRDLALRELVEAMAHRGIEMAQRIGDPHARLARRLHGDVAHLGHRGHKVLRTALGVDSFRCDAWDWIGDPRDLWFLADASLDGLLVTTWPGAHGHRAFAEWLRVLRPDGQLLVHVAGDADRLTKIEQLLAAADITEIQHAALGEGHRVEVEVRRRPAAARGLQAPQPRVSVIVVGEVTASCRADAEQLRTSVAMAHESLAGIPHEVLAVSRNPRDSAATLALHDYAASQPACRVIDGSAPATFPRRFDRAWRASTGDWVFVLQAGTMAIGDALARVVAAAVASGAAMALPTLVGAGGEVLDPAHAPGACVLLRRDAIAAGAWAACRYRTPLVWHALEDELTARTATIEVGDAVVVTGAWASRAAATGNPGQLAFDAALGCRGVAFDPPDPPARILVVCMGAMGDCVLALPALQGLDRSYGAAHITVLTEKPFTWIFEHHPAVDEVVAFERHRLDELAAREDECIERLVESRDHDLLVVLSNRLDDLSYHHTGLGIGAHFAAQAGVSIPPLERPALRIAPDQVAAARRILDDLGVRAPYAVVHTKASQEEKTPPGPLMYEITRHLAEHHGLHVVVVGGPGELVAHPLAANLAGHVGAAVSAAVIAGARLFVGPDAGTVHIASAFDVPTVALFAGTSARTAPPLASTARVIQAPRSCAVPCGRSPCVESVPCAQTWHPPDVLTQIDHLLATGGESVELRGREPALWLRSPNGHRALLPSQLMADRDPGLIRANAEPAVTAAGAAAEPTADQPRATVRIMLQDATSATSVLERRNALDRAPAEHRGHRDLEGPLARVDSERRTEILAQRTLIAARRGQSELVADLFAKVLSSSRENAVPTDDTMHWLFGQLAEVMAPTVTELDTLAGLFQQLHGEEPACGPILAWFGGNDVTHQELATRANLRRALVAAADPTRLLPADTAATLARVLIQIGAVEPAEHMLSAILDDVARDARAEHAELLLWRGLAHVGAARFADAMTDLRAVRTSGGNHRTVLEAEQLVAKLESVQSLDSTFGAAPEPVR